MKLSHVALLVFFTSLVFGGITLAQSGLSNVPTAGSGRGTAIGATCWSSDGTTTTSTCQVSATNTTSGYTSAAASGNNAFAASTNGARVDFGAGASDYASSNGSVVTFASPLSSTGALTASGASGDVSLAGGDLTSTLATQSFNITGEINAATASSTVAAVTIQSSVALDANDLVCEVNNSTGASMFTVDYEGDTVTAGDISLGGADLTSTLATQTFNVVGAINAATASSTVGAVTISPSVALDTNDLVCEVNNAVGGSLFTVDYEGDTVTAGDISLGGGDLTSSLTTQTFNIVSAISAATASSTVAAVTLAPSATLDANDLVCEVNNAAGGSLFTVDLEGDGVVAGDVSLGGADLTSTLATQTFNVVGAINAATASSTVGAVTISPSATLDADDLVLNVEAVTGGTNVTTVDLEGDVTTVGRFTTSATTGPGILTQVNDGQYHLRMGANNGFFLSSSSTVVNVNAAGSNAMTMTAALINATGDFTFGGGDLRSSFATQTFNVIGQINAATASSTVAAVTISPSVTLDADDLIMNVEAVTAGTNLFTVDLEGDVRALLSFGLGTVMNWSATAPTSPVACTSPSITHGTATSFQADVGTTCGVVNTFSFTLPTATNSWDCWGSHLTAPTTRYIAATAWSTTSVTMTNFDRTLGTAAAFVDGADLAIHCVSR